MSLVSITQTGRLVRLRRYERATKRCTHDGSYEPATILLPNLEYYRAYGATQDLVGLLPPRRRRDVTSTSSA